MLHRGPDQQGVFESPSVSLGATSMLDIATQAKVSKRDLYALYANKHALLADCLRITVGTTEENEILMARMRELCAGETS